MTMNTNKPPCGQSCPNRTPTCHKECEAFRQYDEQRLAASAERQGTYNRHSASTIGGERRYVNNMLWRLKKSRGEIS